MRGPDTVYVCLVNRRALSCKGGEGDTLKGILNSKKQLKLAGVRLFKGAVPTRGPIPDPGALKPEVWFILVV